MAKPSARRCGANFRNWRCADVDRLAVHKKFTGNGGRVRVRWVNVLFGIALSMLANVAPLHASDAPTSPAQATATTRRYRTVCNQTSLRPSKARCASLRSIWMRTERSRTFRWAVALSSPRSVSLPTLMSFRPTVKSLLFCLSCRINEQADSASAQSSLTFFGLRFGHLKCAWLGGSGAAAFDLDSKQLADRPRARLSRRDGRHSPSPGK